MLHLQAKWQNNTFSVVKHVLKVLFVTSEIHSRDYIIADSSSSLDILSIPSVAASVISDISG